MRPSLHLELTAHGFGHLAQTAPVLNALRDRLPALRLIVRSALRRPVLAAHLHGDFLHVAEAGDVGMLMDSAVDVRVADSAAAYRALYAGRRHDTAALVDNQRRNAPEAYSLVTIGQGMDGFAIPPMEAFRLEVIERFTPQAVPVTLSRLS